MITSHVPVTLEDKYLLQDGRILLTGIQALVRLALDQHRADARRGLRTGTLVSGYQGSPLGGLDREFQRNRAICERHHVRHIPAINEELAATSAMGSQLAYQLPGSSYDGALALWYGKGPGIDRATDALRHANFAGIARTGGAIAAVGDDPSCKSSTIPSASESLLANLNMPVFYPGNVQEILDLGLHAFACSRFSGLWSGLKIATNVADGLGTAEVSTDRIMPVDPEGAYVHVPDGKMLAPASLEMERTMYGERTDLALAYARANSVNRIEGARDAWIGIICAGKTYYDLRQALRDMGLGDDHELDRAGVRLLKLGMVWPLEHEIVRTFARGLDEVLVVEEKRAFVETQVKEALYGGADAPRVVGKRSESGDPLLPAASEFDADLVASVIGSRLRSRIQLDGVDARLRTLEEIAARQHPALLERTPFFCSGCPHNSSLQAPDGQLVGVGIGCHSLVLLSQSGKGELTGLTQMGGEGAQWIGMAPFTDDAHMVQNMGDGTFHHSGSLAVRAAVAAGVNMTFKLLYNDAVAMTGGQRVEGRIAVPELTRWLELEGVRRVIVTTDDLSRYQGVALAGIAEVRHRLEVLAAQRDLAAVEGVTALIHDQQCAAELRRKRKRGTAPRPNERLWINERVCEGCGDCGKKSSCLSLWPVETEFGRKTQIHQASCNTDETCLEGDCPSFLTVVPGQRARRVPPPLPVALTDPAPLVSSASFTVRMMGIGGTGVVTVNQVLATAAVIDGLHVTGLDQTGLSQKGGPVVSDLHLSRERIDVAGKAAAGGVDLYLGLDLVGATSRRNLMTASPDRTFAVISTSAIPTGRMVVDPSVSSPALQIQVAEIDGATRPDGNIYLDAERLSDRLFGDNLPSNMIALGAAVQQGLVPVPVSALEEAIRLNGAAVETNLAALAWGRAAVQAPDAVERALATPPAAQTGPATPANERHLAEFAAGDDQLRALLERRVADLCAYQDSAYAGRYAETVRRVHAAEQTLTPGSTELTAAVARSLYKLMAYKDEYEVARLHLDAVEQARLHDEFGEGAIVMFNLHPPFLRALGMNRKLRLGPWFEPALRALRAGRRVRGTRLDPFGYTEMRRVERALIDEYLELVTETLAILSPGTWATALQLLELPDVVRGYEDVKLRNVALFRQRAAVLRHQMRSL